MRVLLATMQFGRGYAQGTERYLSLLMAGLRQRGHEAVVVAGDPEHRGPRLEFGETLPDEPDVRFFPSPGWLLVFGTRTEAWCGLLEREKPDLVHLVNPGHLGVSIIHAARQLGIPVVATVMDFWWLCPKHSLGHYTGRVCDAEVTWRECVRCIAAGDARGYVRAIGATPVLRAIALPLVYFGKAVQRGASPRDIGRWTDRRRHLRAALDACAAVIFPSQAAYERIAPQLTKASAHRIPYGLEPRWFEYPGRRRERQLGEQNQRAPESLVIGFAGALMPHKGPHRLLEALHSLGWNATRVRIAGGGPDAAYRARLEHLARGLNVEFAGRMPPDQMPAFLDSLDLLVFPSLSPENLPLLILEAHAIGLPVLAADMLGVAEAVPDPRLRFAPGDPGALAARLSEFAASLPRAVQTTRLSTVDEMVERTLEVYRASTSPPGSAAR